MAARPDAPRLAAARAHAGRLGLLLLALGSIAAADSDPPVITHVRIERAPVNAELVVRAKIDDASPIFAPSVYVRPVGDTEFVALEMVAEGDGFVAKVPPERVGKNLEYFIEAFDEQGNGPAREGSPEAPFRVEVFDPAAPVVVAPDIKDPDDPGDDDEDSILGAWWFWTAVGVVAVGGVTAVALAAGGGQDTVDVVVTGPYPTEALP